MNHIQRKLIETFEASVPSMGTTFIMFTHPNAPSLLMSRDPKILPQVVPVLLAHTSSGGSDENTLLGVDLSMAGDGWLPLFRELSDGKDFYGVMTPFLFYRPRIGGTFGDAASRACAELAEEGRLTDWCIVRCGIKYLTKDGRFHSAEEYAQALNSQGANETPVIPGEKP